MPQWTGKWPGGRTYQSREGQTVWFLEKMVAGVSYNIRLRVRNEQDALAELALFRRDPVVFASKSQTSDPESPDSVGGPVRVDDEGVGAFLEYLKTKGRTLRYRKNVRAYLAEWAVPLFGSDLRKVSVQQYLRILAGWRDGETGLVPGRKHRVAIIKSYCSWLREQGRLAPHEDASLSLKVPVGVPEKARRKKGYDAKTIEALYGAVTGRNSKKYGWKDTNRITDAQSIRDVLCLRVKYGLHHTEVERIARGDGVIRVLPDQGEIAGTIRFVHKNGRMHTISIDAFALAAAQRLQARGGAPSDSYVLKILREAADSAQLGVTISPGELRHTFTTVAKQFGREVRPTTGGVPLTTVAAVLGHQSTRTTSLHYDGTEVPIMIALPLKLEHPDDPVSLFQRKPADRSG